MSASRHTSDHGGSACSRLHRGRFDCRGLDDSILFHCHGLDAVLNDPTVTSTIDKFHSASGRYLDRQDLDSEISWRYLDSQNRVRARVFVRVRVRVRVSYDCPVYDCQD